MITMGMQWEYNGKGFGRGVRAATRAHLCWLADGLREFWLTLLLISIPLLMLLFLALTKIA